MMDDSIFKEKVLTAVDRLALWFLSISLLVTPFDLAKSTQMEYEMQAADMTHETYIHLH